jgi:hypothetical protein
MNKRPDLFGFLSRALDYVLCQLHVLTNEVRFLGALCCMIQRSDSISPMPGTHVMRFGTSLFADVAVAGLAFQEVKLSPRAPGIDHSCLVRYASLGARRYLESGAAVLFPATHYSIFA